MWESLGWVGIVLVVCCGLATCNYNNNQTTQKAMSSGYVQEYIRVNNKNIWVKEKK